MTSFVSESFMIFFVLYDYVKVVTVICDIMLILTLSSKVRNKWKGKEKIRMKNENKPSPMFIILTVADKSMG